MEKTSFTLSLHNSTIMREPNWTFLFSGSGKRELSKDQANKSARGMPWHQEPMKDVISCDKLRGVANEH